MFKFDINEYKWVLLVASLISFHYTMTGFWAGSKRRKTFSKEFMAENFEKEHQEAFPGQKVPNGGYPDMGNGRYSQKLSYEAWYNFNNAQRSHYNYLESVTCVLCWLLIAGIGYNWYAVAFGSAYLIGRLLYSIGYAVFGPRGRVIGFLISLLCSIALFVLSIISPLRMANVISTDVGVGQ